MLCEALDAAGLENWRIGLGDASLYPRLLDRVGVPEGARPQILHELVTRDYVGLAREVRGASARRTLLELPQRRGGPEVLERARGRSRWPRCTALLPEAVAGADHLRPRPHAAALGYYTGAVFEVYDAGARRRRSAAAGATTTCSGASGAPLPAVRLGARRRAAARRARGGGPVSAALTIAVPRGALLGETLDLLDALGIDTAEVRANDRKLLFEDAGLVTMRPSDVPTYVEAGAADLGHHGQGRARRAPRARRLRAARPRLRAVPDGVRDRRRRGPRGRGAAPARRHARRDEVPADRRRATSSAPAARPRSSRSRAPSSSRR